MPGLDSMYPKQVQYIKDWLTQHHGGPPRCGICGQASWDEWSIESISTKYLPVRSTSLADAVTALICQRCGQMLLFDPVPMRLPPETPVSPS